MKEGIENIKNCVGFVLDITEDVQSAMSDGKFSIKDTVLFNTPLSPTTGVGC